MFADIFLCAVPTDPATLPLIRVSSDLQLTKREQITRSNCLHIAQKLGGIPCGYRKPVNELELQGPSESHVFSLFVAFTFATLR